MNLYKTRKHLQNFQLSRFLKTKQSYRVIGLVSVELLSMFLGLFLTMALETLFGNLGISFFGADCLKILL
jgi:hypothetical protein